MLLDAIYLLVGIALLVFGGDTLVRGAAGLARALGVSTLVVGLTVVAFGTSAPELAVNVLAAVRGQGEISFGNIIGSNIANIGLILGTAALIRPVDVKLKVITREIPFMLLATLAAINLACDGLWDGATWSFSRNDGITLLLFFSIFLYYSFVAAQEDRAELLERVGEIPASDRSIGILLLITLAGIVMVGLGGEATVRGAVGVAEALGVSKAVIGLTVIAFGTSLPELATSLVAAYRQHEDIALGNIVGSNVFNLLFILGVTSTIGTVPVPRSGGLDMAVMFGLSAVLFPLAMTNRRRITRWEGLALLVAYAGYIYYRAVHLGTLPTG